MELLEAAAKLIRSVLEELIRQAAQAAQMHNDDRGMRILSLARAGRHTHLHLHQRGGVDGRRVENRVDFTGWKHAGQNLAGAETTRRLPL
jgi:hypothetical protein